MHFTGEAFDVVPGGHSVAAIVLGAALGVGTFRLHRHSIEHEAYRTFNLIAMLLAVGSLASMSITPTGAWWTHNFSTLGTSDDIAAACFNIAIVLSGAGMAAMSAGAHQGGRGAPVRDAPRRARRDARRSSCSSASSLMGVGLVPIDGATDLHNAAASTAAAAFALLCLGVQVWARRLPRSLVAGSYLSIAIEVVAMIAYDGIGVFNLTVFEVVAFTLVFAWLIALVAITHSSPRAGGCRDRPSSRPRRAVGAAAAPSPVWSSTRRRATALDGRPPGRIPSRLPRPADAHRRVPRRPTSVAEGRGRSRRSVRRTWRRA